MKPQPTVENYLGELAMLRGLVRTLRIAARGDDLAEVQRLLYEHVIDEAAAHETREQAPYTEAGAAFHQLGTTPALRGLRAALLIDGHPLLIGQYCGVGLRPANHRTGVLIAEPMLAFTYAEGGTVDG